MRKYILFVFLLIIVNQATAIYTTPGTGKNWNLDSLVANSGGHITFSSGFYYINDTLVVSQADTIKILNNVRVRFYNLAWINVNGVFLINPPDSAKFTANDTAQRYIGITFQSTSSSSIVKRLIMEYGRNFNMLNCSFLIDSCIFRFNWYNTASTPRGAIYLSSGSSPLISNCFFYRNMGPAISSPGNSNVSPSIINNFLLENNTLNANVAQINLGSANTNPLIIRNNTIRGLFTRTGGIAIFPAGGTNAVPNLLIENNRIKKNRYGIVLYNVNISGYIKNNIIDSNNIQSIPDSGGSGINFNGNSTINTILTGNTIRWNLWGVTVQGTAKPNFGNLDNADTTDNGRNKIYFNSHNDTTFDYYNNTPDSLKAENNYWGTTNLDTIEAHIWHKPDNASLGFVDYIPIDLFTGVTKNETSSVPDFKLYDAYPNPFNPSTNIKYLIKKGVSSQNSEVRLIVYDILGKEIETLVNEKQSPGTYSVDWNASQYPSGVYFYKLETESYTDTKKLILLK